MNENSKQATFDKVSSSDDGKKERASIRFSLRDDSDAETNIAGYSAATIMNSVSTEADTESDVAAKKRRRRRDKRADSIVVCEFNACM
ncbi:hypothetical protein Ciccas_008562 [Cichlidogyrus casuarinus]|uniref:Uncharacterized protein n=1 Tax=Cichlidogyrus casuarinus TaxID=1844966 RepID=A0ABD2PZJ5_9PLAT